MVDEKQVRQYRDGRKSVPLSVLFALPVELTEEIVGRLLEKRGAKGARRSVAQLRRALDSLAEISDADRYEVFRALLDAQRRLTALIVAFAPKGER